MNIKYDCIKAEFKRLGLTNKRVADILGISVQTLDYRIKKDQPSIHLITMGLVSYFEDTDGTVDNYGRRERDL